MKYLDNIENINLKTLNINQLNELSNEIRTFLINKLSEVGGHLASNLGIIELSIALHYVFNDNDKFIFDGSHQTYTHKILTGRYEGFKKFKQSKEVTGLSNHNESKHDVFSVGHTSSSIALGCGLVVGRNINKSKENIIVVIGDGSLSGSEAYSGLNNAATLDGQMLIILNDNDHSIAKNYGGIYKHLKELRESKGTLKNNIFKNIGLEYTYVEDANNIQTLVDKLNEIKNINKPIVMHVHTMKGYGYKPAIENKEKFHYVDPFNVSNGKFLYDDVKGSYKRFISDYLINKVNKNKNLMVINSGIPTILALIKYREKHPDNYIDTGICEDYSISLASGISKQGLLPIVLHMSSFSQRMYDQLSQDICLNNLPMVLLIEGAGIGACDASHSGLFDMTLFSNIPNFIYLEPRNIKDLKLMLDYAIKVKRPIGIRVPFRKQNTDDYPLMKIVNNKYEIVKEGKDIAILSLGSFFNIGIEVYEKLKSKGYNPTLINPRFTNIIDEETLSNIEKTHDIIITIENSCIHGGFGEKIDSYFSSKNNIVLNYSFGNEFYDRIPIQELYNEYKIDSDRIIKEVMDNYGKRN